MTRRFLLGADGPEVRVPAKAAYLLGQLGLRVIVDRLRADQISLDDDTEDVLDALLDAASWYDAQRQSVFREVPAESASVMVDPMTTSEAAERLGTTSRNVTQLAKAGSLRFGARKVQGRWLIERQVVEDYAAARSN